MITTCTHCNARYRLDAGKVPRRMIRVRCPGCNGVFHLDGAEEPTAQANEGMPEGFVTGFEPGSGSQTLNTPTAPPEPAVAQDFAPEAPEAPEVPLSFNEAAPAAQLDTPPAPPKAAGRRRRSKEEMLARALVSDILVYNRDLRDKSIAEGNLAQAMSAEIKKSWELYKEKVTPEVATQSECFREALNEILAEGEKVF
jgi:predicted Zn finger-like uncharacterized protein